MTTIESINPDGFEWDEVKNRVNLEKHGIGFERASQIFDGPILRLEDNRRVYGEIRYKCIGRIDGGLFAVVFTPRNGLVRIISARRARRDERREYRQVLQR